MKKLIEFTPEDCPSNMGASQLVDDVAAFVAEREAILPSAKVTATKLTFIKPDGTTGTATIKSVEDDHKNF